MFSSVIETQVEVCRTTASRPLQAGVLKWVLVAVCLTGFKTNRLPFLQIMLFIYCFLFIHTCMSHSFVSYLKFFFYSSIR